VAREPHEHYEGVDLAVELGGDWNSFVSAGDPDRQRETLAKSVGSFGTLMTIKDPV